MRPSYRWLRGYAVIMTMIANFEEALGRPVMWSARIVKDHSRRRQRENQMSIAYLWNSP